MSSIEMFLDQERAFWLIKNAIGLISHARKWPREYVGQFEKGYAFAKDIWEGSDSSGRPYALTEKSVTSGLLIWPENDISKAKDFAPRHCESNVSSLARISFRALFLSRVWFKYITTIPSYIDCSSIIILPGLQSKCTIFSQLNIYI